MNNEEKLSQPTRKTTKNKSASWKIFLLLATYKGKENIAHTQPLLVDNSHGLEKVRLKDAVLTKLVQYVFNIGHLWHFMNEFYTKLYSYEVSIFFFF